MKNNQKATSGKSASTLDTDDDEHAGVMLSIVNRQPLILGGVLTFKVKSTSGLVSMAQSVDLIVSVAKCKEIVTTVETTSLSTNLHINQGAIT